MYGDKPTPPRRVQSDVSFQVPKGDPSTRTRFYQHDYEAGFTSDLPSDEELEQMRRAGFNKADRDFTPRGRLCALGAKTGSLKLFEIISEHVHSH